MRKQGFGGYKLLQSYPPCKWWSLDFKVVLDSNVHDLNYCASCCVLPGMDCGRDLPMATLLFLISIYPACCQPNAPCQIWLSKIASPYPSLILLPTSYQNVPKHTKDTIVTALGIKEDDAHHLPVSGKLHTMWDVEGLKMTNFSLWPVKLPQGEP